MYFPYGFEDSKTFFEYDFLPSIFSLKLFKGIMFLSPFARGQTWQCGGPLLPWLKLLSQCLAFVSKLNWPHEMGPNHVNTVKKLPQISQKEENIQVDCCLQESHIPKP